MIFFSFVFGIPGDFPLHSGHSLVITEYFGPYLFQQSPGWVWNVALAWEEEVPMAACLQNLCSLSSSVQLGAAGLSLSWLVLRRVSRSPAALLECPPPSLLVSLIGEGES